MSVGPAGIYLLTSEFTFVRTGATAEVPEGVSWAQVNGELGFLDSGSYYMYGASSANELFFYDASGYNSIGTENQNIRSLAVSSEVLWVVTEDNIIYRKGLSDTNKAGETPGTFTNDGKVFLEASKEGLVLSLDQNGSLYFREGLHYADPIGTRWIPMHSPKFVRVAAAPRELLGLDDEGKFWKAALEHDASYIGCYREHNMNPDLKGTKMHTTDMTVGKCRRVCALNNYRYAGLQLRGTCACGDTYGLHGKYPESDCSTSCHGNSYEICGGWSRNSIYKSGRVEITEISSDQLLAENEDVELICGTESTLSPVFVAWLKDGVVLQNRTRNTNLAIAISHHGIFIYTCIANFEDLSDSKNITVTVDDSILPCGNHKSVNDPSRSTGNCGLVKTIQRLSPSEWYQFYGSGGTQLPTKCVKENKCGGKASGWFNGRHPEREDGVVTGQLCFSYEGDCCYFSVNVNVRHCYGYYIYKFHEIPDYFTGRICTEKEPVGTGLSTKVTSKVFSSSGRTTNMAMDGHKIATYPASSSSVCNIYCLLKSQCESFNYNPVSKECELNNDKATKSFSNLVSRQGFSYYHPVGTGMKIIHKGL